MQAGFLGPSPAAKASAPPPQPIITQTDPAVDANLLAECIELLKGPSDERKLVGLLMVPSALPPGNPEILRQVYAAVGPTFLARLLLPLRVQRPAAEPPLSLEAAQKEEGLAALGLTVLSSIAQVPNVAASSDFLSLTPLFLNIVRAGGISPLLASRTAAKSGGSAAGEASTATDVEGVRHALECAAAVAASGEEGSRIAEESGALEAAATALHRSSALINNEEEVLEGDAWAVRLAAAVLASMDPAVIIQALDGGEMAALVAGLARTFALPALVSEEAAKRRAVGLHLEALQALLMILPWAASVPGCLCSLGYEGDDGDGSAAGSGIWEAHMRLGVGLVLQGRVGMAQRHAALQLAAATVAVAGPEWLAGDGKFFQLVVEVTGVETSVLLHDALAPQARVPAFAPPTAALLTIPEGSMDRTQQRQGESLPPSSSQITEEGEDEESSSMGASLQQGQTSHQAAATVEKEAAEAEEQFALDNDEEDDADEDTPLGSNAEIPPESPAAAANEAAGARALRMLPCCFSLFEAAVEVLAASESPQPPGSGDSFSVLPPEISHRALASLHQTADTLLQFLEQTTEESDRIDDPATASVQVGAVRALGRFLAELPDAFGDRLRAALPRMLGVRVGDVFGDSVSPSLIGESPPSVSSLTYSFGDFIHKVRGEDEEPRGSGLAEGVTFLLPLLLQVTDPQRASEIESLTSSGEGGEGGGARKWVETITQGGGLHHLVDYAVFAAGDAAAGGPDGPLVASARVLLQVLMDAQPLDAASHTEGLRFAVADAAWPLVTALTEALSSSAAATIDASCGKASAEERLGRAACCACCAALLAEVLAAVAAEADHPDAAHAAQQVLFSRDSLRTGLGPISRTDAKLACEALACSMRDVRSTLIALESPSNALEESLTALTGDCDAMQAAAEKLVRVAPEWVEELVAGQLEGSLASALRLND